MAARVAIFIDGAYLEHVMRNEFKEIRIDFQALSERLAGPSDILRTYYYHCPSYQSDPPTDDERRRYATQRKFFDVLDRLPRYKVRLGRLAFRGIDGRGRPRYEQKRVDILLGVDMVQLAAKQAIQEAVLLAGDSDFIPAVTASQSEGVVIRLFHGQRPHNDLWRVADERTQITEGLVESILLGSIPSQA